MISCCFFFFCYLSFLSFVCDLIRCFLVSGLVCVILFCRCVGNSFSCVLAVSEHLTRRGPGVSAGCACRPKLRVFVCASPAVFAERRLFSKFAFELPGGKKENFSGFRGPLGLKHDNPRGAQTLNWVVWSLRRPPRCHKKAPGEGQNTRNLEPSAGPPPCWTSSVQTRHRHTHIRTRTCIRTSNHAPLCSNPLARKGLEQKVFIEEGPVVSASRAFSLPAEQSSHQSLPQLTVRAGLCDLQTL